MTKDIRRYLENWQAEVDSTAQYRAMAEAESRANVGDVYQKLAAVEEKHAAFWEDKMRAAGYKPGARRPSWRARTLVWIAKHLGASVVLPTIASREYADRNDYLAHPETRGTQMTEEERMHARVLGDLLAKTEGVQGSALATIEGRHRNIGGNALRAAVLGANDGLCSNLSLVMGVAGAEASHRFILLMGIAGLVAGACSMALGEWVSVTSARELAEREIRIERGELENNPEEEREELQLIYELKGLNAAEAKDFSSKLMKDPQIALDALSREELGIDPAEKGGSATQAAVTSFLLFAFGAIVPVLPYFFVGGRDATIASVAVAGLGLFGIGAMISLFTGRSVWFSGGRQLVLGFLAAAVTFGVGRIVGSAPGVS